MIKKKLLIHTTTLFRAVLLLGTLAFVTPQQTQAQNSVQQAAMPDAFETMDPATVIGDGQYYHIQFYFGNDITYLSDQGSGNAMRSKDYIPFAKNLQWTLVSTGTANQFKLKSLNGNWAYFDNGTYKSSDSEATATTFTFYNRNDGGYEIGPTTDTGHTMAGNNSSVVWVDIWNNTKGNARSCLRIAKLKSNVAHIIYWQETIRDNNNNPVDPNSEYRGRAAGFTAHHYLTYSGTDNNRSDVSSRKSVVWYYDAWNTLATLAAYHQDGLWTLEQSGSSEKFYIKKYGTEEYLNYDGNGASMLGTKDADYGKYVLEMPSANRYTRIQNDNKFDADPLTAAMFYEWDGCRENATITGSHNVGVYFGNGTNLNPGETVYGDGWTVHYLHYADLTGYTKIVFEGTSGLELRVLMNRDVPDGTDGDWGGAFLDRRCTIGANGMAEVVLSDLTFAHLNSIKVNSGTGQVSSVTLVKPRYDVTQLASSQFYNWNGYGADATSTSTAQVAFNVGNNLGSGATVAGTGDVDYLIYANMPGCKKIVFEGTPGVQLRVLMNRQESNSGPLEERTATISNYGKAEVDLSDLPYVHLNAIKTGWNSPEGTVTSIKFMSLSSGGNTLSLSCNKTDGAVVSQVSGGDTNYRNSTYWVAGFMPVEVPVPNKDEFYQVLLQLKSNTGQMVDYDGGATAYSEEPQSRKLFQLEQVDDYSKFRLKNPSGEYLRPYPNPGGVTEPNNPDGADLISNLTLIDEKFYVKWFFVNPVAKEIPVNYYVKHKESYLRPYAAGVINQEGLRKQGLATDVDSEWWNFDGNGFDDPQKGTQKTNHFEITHFVKKGNSKTIEFPTVLNENNDHILFQRFYNYDEADTSMDLDNLKSHVSLDTRDDGNVQYFLYKNGMVTGQKLDWTNVDDGGYARYEKRRFNFTNSDGQPFTVAVDVSRYSDLEYLNSTDHLTGDLREPSLTMRYIFYMNDAKDMAKRLTACPEGGDKWLETKEFHFGRTQVPYTKYKKVGYRGEFIPVRHVFSDYWVYDDPNLFDDDYVKNLLGIPTNTELNAQQTQQISDYLDQHLVSAVNNNEGGKIEVEVVPGNTGIRKGGYNPNIDLRGYENEGDDGDYQGFYFYDRIARNQKTEYGKSRFVVFRYPESGFVENCGPDNPAYIRVYLNAGGNRYQLAQFTIYFDANMATRPWTELKNGTTYANGVNLVKGTPRDPNELRKRAGKPIAKISFDYPVGETYHYPTAANCPSTDGNTRHDGWERGAGGSIDNSSPVPLTFGHTNYSFDGDGANWGSYALVTKKRTTWGNDKEILPADDDDYGYKLPADPGMQKAFLYIDASEQPGDICAMDFEGEFCASDQLMCTGWISGCNRYNDDGEHRCPGSITLTVKGEDVYGNTVTIYRFCPGQIYELDNGYNLEGGDVTNSAGVDGSGNNADHVVWQQFYFEFSTDHKYERYWLEVNNNCVSSNGGDFMLDNVEVYTIVPEVKPDINTPLCVSLNDNNEPVVDMRLLKLNVNFNKLKSSANVTSGKTKIGFVFLEKDVFLKKLWDLKHLESTYENIDSLALAIKEGRYLLDGSDSDYKTAFDAALLGDKEVWDSSTSTSNMGAGVMYFEWDTTFENNELYTFAKAVNKEKATFRYTDDEGDWLVFNGNYPVLPWKTDTEYYIVPTNNHVTSFDEVYGIFDICSACSKASAFKIEAPYTLIGLGASEDANDYMVCEGQIPTLVSDLKGYDFNGVEVPMNDINYDWWLGDKANGVLPTLETYHAQEKNGVRLDVALSTLRIYYPEVTSLDGIVSHAAVNSHPALTTDMVNYLRELVEAGQLVLHQKSISVPAKPTSEVDPYFYLVACPIHDEQYDQSLNPHGPTSIINNGAMEGFETASFYTRYNNINSNATISGGVGKNGSRGINVTSAAAPSGDSNAWDTQFFIRANEVIPVGTTFHLEFDYKASSAATVHTQFHSEPSNCIYYNGAGDLGFTTEWKHFKRDIEVTSDMAPNNNFQSIAFDLWNGNDETGNGITYFFDNVELTVNKNYYVAFFCDEPQGLRVKVGDKAPTLKTGFVSGENGFDSYNYTGAGDAVLSIRLAKREQFETVKHGEPDAATIDTPETTSAETTHFLWLPVRNAFVQTDESNKVIQKSEDENIYLASTNDPVWDKNIYKAMKKGSLPVVGKIVQLNAIDVSKNSNLNENDYNRLCVYFTENFEVREGYSYTLSLPFQESPGENTCDGTILINLKIVPDYEVWTGAAGNTDWNNDENWRRADGNMSSSIDEKPDGSKRNNNELYRTDDLPDTSPLKDYVTNYTNYRTPKDRILRKGFAPLYCTHVLIKSNEWGDAPVLYDALAGKNALDASPFPNLRDKDGWDGTVTDEDAGTEATKATSTPILRYDMQARHFELWEETYGVASNKGRTGDLIAEMYQVNSCDEIAIQPGAELLNTHLLNYNNAWVEYQLDNKRWYLLGSPLQGTISGEWYAPTGTAQQKTTYYENVTFGAGYDRYSPAIYQRSWDKAKAVLYEIGSAYSTADNPDDLALNPDGSMPGAVEQGSWNGAAWNDSGADDYLDRLGYKPLGNKKVNVAIKGVWSNTYNDATVDYTKGGFSVMVMNHLKGNDDSNGKSIIRLPKEDTMYDYYQFSETGAVDGGTDTNLDGVQSNLNRALNRGRLKTDQLLPTIGEGLATYLKIQRAETTASRYGDMRTYTRVPTRVGTNGLPMTLQPFTESVSAGISNLGYYLVENPFVAGLDMEKFFAANPGLEKKYWILTPNGQQLVQRVAGDDWVSPTEEVVTGEEPNTETTYHFTAANAKVAPGQGFFVQAQTAGDATTITFNADMQAQTRYGEPDEGEEFEIVVGSKQKMKTVGVTYDHDDDPNTPEVALMIDDDNDPSTPVVQATVEVPEVDGDGNPVVEDITETVTIFKYKQKKGDGYEFPLKARTRTADAHTLGLVITAQRGDLQSSALVMQRADASNDFLPSEDTETFICTEDLKQVPTIYTLCGRLATTVNSIHDFRSLSLGVESASDAPCTLTFHGVEQLGDSVAFYDAVERKLTPLESGMKFTVSGQTQNRYYLVRSLDIDEAAAETHLQIFTEGLTATVIASTQEPITSVRCTDAAGRLILVATPNAPTFSFRLPAAGVYVIEAQTEHDRKVQKHQCK
jgi:hypothetical protein